MVTYSVVPTKLLKMKFWGKKYCDVFMLDPRLDSVTLDNASANVIDLSSSADVEFCECPQGYTGISCEVTVLCVQTGLFF